MFWTRADIARAMMAVVLFAIVAVLLSPRQCGTSVVRSWTQTPQGSARQ
jgi:hypothetical protein